MLSYLFSLQLKTNMIQMSRNKPLYSQLLFDYTIQGQPGLKSEFQDSQGYTEKPCLKTKQKKKQRKEKKYRWAGCISVLEGKEVANSPKKKTETKQHWWDMSQNRNQIKGLPFSGHSYNLNRQINKILTRR